MHESPHAHAMKTGGNTSNRESHLMLYAYQPILVFFPSVLGERENYNVGGMVHPKPVPITRLSEFVSFSTFGKLPSADLEEQRVENLRIGHFLHMKVNRVLDSLNDAKSEKKPKTAGYVAHDGKKLLSR